MQFEHDPFDWFHSDEPDVKAANLKQIVSERQVNGFSFWDWINFADYYCVLVKTILEKVISGDIRTSGFPAGYDGPFESVQKLAEDMMIRVDITLTVADYLDETHVLNNDYYSLDGLKSMEQNSVLYDFFHTLVWCLPFQYNYVIPQADRGEKVGVLNPADYDSVGSFAIRILVDGVHRFQTGNGSPAEYDTFNDWVAVLKVWEREFTGSLATGAKPDDRVVDKLVYHFASLWD